MDPNISMNNLCNKLLGILGATEATETITSLSQEDLNALALIMVKMKSCNRKIHQVLATKRSEVEAKKGRLESLQLKLENLLYKQAHLKREIKTCKDLSTPTLAEIEKEVNTTLGTTKYSENLKSVHDDTIQKLNDEMQSRIATQEELNAVTQRHQQSMDVLDKKRKFLEDMPVKIANIKTVASGLEEQFRQHESEISS